MITAPSTNLVRDFYAGEGTFPVTIPDTIVDWDTSAVTNMFQTFAAQPGRTNPMNLDIGGWDTSAVTTMELMFSSATSFNQDIGGWDTGSVSTYVGMFANALQFNQDISGWNLNSAEYMTYMFSGASSFNQDLSGWDMSNVSGVVGMFQDASSFDQDLGAWDISSIDDARWMFDNSGMSMANFDATLAGWSQLDAGETQIQSKLTLGAEGLTYSNLDAVNTLTTLYNWTISGATYAFAGSDADETIDGSASLYRVVTDGLTGDDQLIGSAMNDHLSGSEGADTLNGGLGLDTLIGGDGDDFIFGGAGEADLRDVVYAGAGNDSVDGGYGNDELRGDAGNDTLLGGFGADTLIGGSDDDVLSGSALSDVIFGGSGDDFINGGFGFDRLNGGTGTDRFFHTGDTGHGSDWVQDYSAAEGDVLLFGGAATIDQFQINFAETANTGTAGVAEAFVIHQPTGHILWALVDGQAQDEITLRLGGQDFDLLA